MPVTDPSSAYDPNEQLARLGRLCRLRSIAVYREQALYLQILRDELGSAVRQALFSLISLISLMDPCLLKKCNF